MTKAWNLCKCENVVGIHFSPEEVLQLLSSFNFDAERNAVEEVTIDSISLTSEEEPSLTSSAIGWIACGYLAAANVAYVVLSQQSDNQKRN